jgi:hypothetical protein
MRMVITAGFLPIPFVRVSKWRTTKFAAENN